MTAITGFERDNEGYFIRKDPEAVMDYVIDYSTFLATGDTIASQTTTADTGITVDSSAILSGDKKIKHIISSGVAGTNYTIKTTATTADGLTLVHRYKIKCELTQLK